MEKMNITNETYKDLQIVKHINCMTYDQSVIQMLIEFYQKHASDGEISVFNTMKKIYKNKALRNILNALFLLFL